MKDKRQLMDEYYNATADLRKAHDRFVKASQNLVYYLEDVARDLQYAYQDNAAVTPDKGTKVTGVIDEQQ